MDFVLSLHSIVRWLVVGISLTCLVVFALVWLGQVKNEKLDRILMSIFTGLVDVQVLLGIILIIGLGVVGYRIEHGVTMIIAAVVGHISIRWRKAVPQIRARNNLILIVVVLALIFMGVARLPGGWAR
jgi:hypothetical protein